MEMDEIGIDIKFNPSIIWIDFQVLIISEIWQSYFGSHFSPCIEKQEKIKMDDDVEHIQPYRIWKQETEITQPKQLVHERVNNKSVKYTAFRNLHKNVVMLVPTDLAIYQPLIKQVVKYQMKLTRTGYLIWYLSSAILST